MPITIQGLTEIQDYLYAIDMKLMAIKTEWLDRFAQKVAMVAKEQFSVADVGLLFQEKGVKGGGYKGGIDTGALLESIGNRLAKATSFEIIEEVFAGSAQVSRGEGRFTYSRKTGEKVSSKATEEYADLVENWLHYMEAAYQWALSNCEAEMSKLLVKVMAYI